MALTYRIQVSNPEPRADGTVGYDVRTQVSDDGGTSWADVEVGHFTHVVNAVALLDVLQGSMTNLQKIGWLKANLLEALKDRGLEKADEAHKELMTLIPDWPQSFDVTT